MSIRERIVFCLKWNFSRKVIWNEFGIWWDRLTDQFADICVGCVSAIFFPFVFLGWLFTPLRFPLSAIWLATFYGWLRVDRC